MTELQKHREVWQGKSDEWLFDRLANELKDKVETIQKLIAENEQLRLLSVVKSVKEGEEIAFREWLKDNKYKIIYPFLLKNRQVSIYSTLLEKYRTDVCHRL